MKKKLYLLFTVCSICLFALVACTDNARTNETENATQEPTDNQNNTNGVGTPTPNDETNGTDPINDTDPINGTDAINGNNTNGNNGSNTSNDNDTNGNNTTEDNGIIDEIEDGIDDANDAINDATDDN